MDSSWRWDFGISRTICYSALILFTWCLLRSLGVQIEFLLPYSPDLNPIEEAFSKFKAFIHQNRCSWCIRVMECYLIWWKSWRLLLLMCLVISYMEVTSKMVVQHCLYKDRRNRGMHYDQLLSWGCLLFYCLFQVNYFSHLEPHFMQFTWFHMHECMGWWICGGRDRQATHWLWNSCLWM